MGCEPAGVRSRIAASGGSPTRHTRPRRTYRPCSGPRWTMRSIMLVSTCSLFSTSPVNPTNPHIGHLSFVWHSIKADKSLKSEFYRACAPSRESSLKRLMPPLFARARKKRRWRDRGNDRIGNHRSNWLRRDRGSHERSSQKQTHRKPRAAAGRRGVASAHNARAPCTACDAARAPRRRTASRTSTHAKGQHEPAFQLSLSDSSRGF